MCEIFGVCSKHSLILNRYLNVFYGHSARHPHGWGLACLYGNDISIVKEAVQASKSGYLQKRLLEPIQAENALAHIRYATIGNVDYNNCHPYYLKDSSGRCWSLIHNGTIFDYPPLETFIHRQAGETDSERILLYLIEKIAEREHQLDRPLRKDERFQLMNVIISDMSKGNKLNLIIFDGELMYVHTNYRDSLYFLEGEDSILFSTTPLSDEDWKPVTFTTLLAYQDGKLKYQGTNHQNKYIESEENTKYLYQIFSNL